MVSNNFRGNEEGGPTSTLKNVASEPSAVEGGNSSISTLENVAPVEGGDSSFGHLTDSGMHAIKPEQTVGAPVDGPTFSTSRRRSRKEDKMRRKSSTTKGLTKPSGQGGHKKRLFGLLVGGITAALLAAAVGVVTFASVYKPKSAEVASADKGALGQPPNLSLTSTGGSVEPSNKNLTADTKAIAVPSTKPPSEGIVSPKSEPNQRVYATNEESKKIVSPYSKRKIRDNVTQGESDENMDRLGNEVQWTPESIKMREAKCAHEVDQSPHAQLCHIDGVPVRRKTRLASHKIRAEQQEDLLLDVWGHDTGCIGTTGEVASGYYDSYVDISKKVGDDSLRKLRFMTLHRLQLFDSDFKRDCADLWETVEAVDSSPTNYDLDHENQIRALPYIKDFRNALANAKNAHQLACQFIHIISGKSVSLEKAQNVKTFHKLKKRLEQEMQSGTLKKLLLQLPINEKEFFENKADAEWD
eukprot:GHVT01022608.1.p1 GENE.GHVT01022608.1~~GHVT01022608.1.p1  ORF type:complete len:470 (-),score=45.28 GHVT01022608.1:234-1643(-)